MELLSLANPGGEAAPQLQDHELANTPIFTGNSQSLISDTAEYTVFHQYALLGAALELLEGKRKSRPRPYDASRAEKEFLDPRVYMNGSAPLSTFICGLQGAGKSHTMSCIFGKYLDLYEGEA